MDLLWILIYLECMDFYWMLVDSDGFIYVTGFFSGYDADFDNLSISNPEWGND